ncbi:hypothetical protein E2562_019625 [Oryza meyeriana var. granulata]|uniref:Uncharacterized protein n=1 Tax=Oryza meyeriana var. granulata TaxID=110450 RepID=A0A6G1C813_9ORYZ|nr:hypothetical protein E2562_019625 [Oryza meyeriana var. granulata]
MAYSNTVVSHAAFGDESSCSLYSNVERGHELKKVLTDFMELLGTEPMGELLPWLRRVDTLRGMEGKVQRMFEALDGILEKVIDDHLRRHEGGRQIDDDGERVGDDGVKWSDERFVSFWSTTPLVAASGPRISWWISESARSTAADSPAADGSPRRDL